MDLTAYRTLGRSGLVVSPLALGTMTFGAGRWGVTDDVARELMNDYVEAGGNFVDTADVYGKGRSEEVIGGFIAERDLRDRIVLATKFTWNLDPGNPNAGGNGRKNMHRALDASLARLKTDYVDLYWLHFWDMTTPADEVVQTLGDFIRAGKIRYYALSDVPAWYATKVATIAHERGIPGPIALQLEYSLVERAAEHEHLPAGHDGGMGFIAWSPLAGGLLAGKYRREDVARSGSGRLDGANPFGDTKFTARNWDIVEVLKRVANEVERSPAQVALAWALARPGVAALLVGATRAAQLKANLASLDLVLSADRMAVLDAASEGPATFPYSGFTPAIRRAIFGGTRVNE